MRNGLLWILSLSLWGCGQLSERKQPPPSLYRLSQSDLDLSGEQLANGYCAACHLKPEPSVLDKTTWETKVLPDMRKRIGLRLEADFGLPLPEDEGIPDGIYSKTPMITRENWEKISAYYLDNAPDSPLSQPEKTAPEKGIPGFELEIPAFPMIRAGLTTMTKIHPETGNLWLGHRYRSIFVLDSKNNFSELDSIPTPVAPVELRWRGDDSFDLLSMGLMDPANDSVGVLSDFSRRGQIWSEDVLIERLNRPVHVEFADWNGDGIEDPLVSHFGNHVGKLSLYLSDGPSFRELILKKDPGARRTVAVDFDADGDLDILVLMTQAREGILLFENQGGGKFREQTLLAFQPAFGCSDFRYEDMNGDGHRDIVLVNGDNADLSQILKNYHGVRIFENDGTGRFVERWFYPMHGASGVEVGDFDQDGLNDLVAISFFPDKKQQTREDLVFFKQSAEGGFEPHVLNASPDLNWLTITKGDLDLDGDLDIVIGTFTFDQLYKPPVVSWRPFVVLRNGLK